MDRIREIIKETDHPFLNYYKMKVTHRNGEASDYYMASRKSRKEDLIAVSHDLHPDGVAIYAVYGEQKDKVVLVRQYRYPLGGYIYELPAGLVEKGEDMAQAAVREFFEETGMTLHTIDAQELYTKPRFTTIGMTDECCGTIFGYAEGIPSNAAQESSEDIEIVIADKAEVRRILQEENVAVMCSYQLMHFLSSEGDPLAFIKTKSE